MHFFELGARKNLALGSDFDGSVLPECLNTPAKVASFYEYLLSRGVSQEDADGVFYRNAPGVLPQESSVTARADGSYDRKAGGVVPCKCSRKIPKNLLN